MYEMRTNTDINKAKPQEAKKTKEVLTDTAGPALSQSELLKLKQQEAVVLSTGENQTRSVMLRAEERERQRLQGIEKAVGATEVNVNLGRFLNRGGTHEIQFSPEEIKISDLENARKADLRTPISQLVAERGNLEKQIKALGFFDWGKKSELKRQLSVLNDRIESAKIEVQKARAEELPDANIKYISRTEAVLETKKTELASLSKWNPFAASRRRELADEISRLQIQATRKKTVKK